jgi:HEPN domain-containing protein
MNSKQLKKQAEYWFLTAKHDYDTMISLFDSKRYSDALFYGHIVIEKSLKLVAVINNQAYAPAIHDLGILRQLASIDLSEHEIRLLKTINGFNIRARYPDHKLDFYKKCNHNYAKFYLAEIKKLYNKLCLNPKLEKLLKNLL